MYSVNLTNYKMTCTDIKPINTHELLLSLFNDGVYDTLPHFEIELTTKLMILLFNYLTPVNE